MRLQFSMTAPVAGVTMVAMLGIIGCGSGSSLELAPVTGTVSYQDRPLDHGRVVFTPTGNTPGPQAVSEIQSDGTFRLETTGSNGAVVGRHTVTVHCRRIVTPEEAQNLVVGELLIPEKYAVEGQTPLSFEVKQGANEFSITLDGQ